MFVIILTYFTISKHITKFLSIYSELYKWYNCQRVLSPCGQVIPARCPFLHLDPNVPQPFCVCLEVLPAAIFLEVLFLFFSPIESRSGLTWWCSYRRFGWNQSITSIWEFPLAQAAGLCHATGHFDRFCQASGWLASVMVSSWWRATLFMAVRVVFVVLRHKKALVWHWCWKCSSLETNSLYSSCSLSKWL